MRTERTNLNLALRINVALIFIAASLIIILVRLWYLQVLNGDAYRVQSENNRLQTIFIPPPRGIITDRKGEVLVSNRPSFNIELISEDTPDEKATVKDLAELIGVSSTQLLNQLREQRRRRKFEPKLLLKDVNRDLVAKISAAKHRLPGITISVVPARNYINGALASHVLGYIREITQKQLESPNYSLYMSGDLVGQSGVESQFEKYLQGERGRQRVIVNATGTRVGELSSENEIVGNTLELTVDANLQRVADMLFEKMEGAVVALAPSTGEVLAMASSRRFDPNIFTRGLTPDEWKDIAAGERLNNKTIQGGYPPGSVFKIFMSIAALAENVISPSEKIFCPGFLTFAGRSYRCHKKSGHGYVDLKSALIQSCDVYYYTVGQRLGVDRINKWATTFGLGNITGLGFPEESQGLIPSSEWKRRYGRGDTKWYAGETLSVSIGQGAVLTTPLQLAVGLSAVVNGGKVYQPQIVRSVTANDGRPISGDFQPKLVREIELDNEILSRVRDAMVGVVNDPRGTAHRAQLDKSLDILVGGKTGTAQVAGLQHGTRGILNDHAWFVGYAPVEDPKIAVVAFVKNGGHGGAVAAPVVKEIMQAFFTGALPTPTPVATSPVTQRSSAPRPAKKAVPTPEPVEISKPIAENDDVD